LRRAGERLRRVDAAVLSATRLAPLAVRAPDIRIVNTRAAHDAILDAACALIAGAVTAGGGKARREGENLEQVLGETDGDAVIAVGGTGSGHGDASVRTLARHGRVEVHGVALLPGETAAFGLAGARPVLLVPGRIDAALAVWLTIGRRMLCRLAGATEAAPATKAVLARKVASPLGFTELIPLRCREGKAKPIASGYWPLAAIVQSDGWMMVPADSEGYPAATEVVVRPWP
jgi:molybdopterin biosynthesis enzyme